MREALVSIIVPCFNQGKYLSESLDSVLAQTYSDWECIIVNDGSNDDSEEIAITYCEKDSRFKYIKQDNQGVSIARNNGIKASNGDYILPLDGDDKIAPTYIEKAVSYLSRNPMCKLVYCEADFFDGRTGHWDLPEYRYDNIIWNNCIFCSAVFRRIDFDKTHGYNPNMTKGNEDWDFWLSLLSPNDEVYKIGEILFYYRQKKTSRTVDMLQDGVQEMFQQLYDNHPPIYAPYVKDIVWCKYQANACGEWAKTLEKEKELILRSFPYRLGRAMTFPVRKLRDVVLNLSKGNKV